MMRVGLLPRFFLPHGVHLKPPLSASRYFKDQKQAKSLPLRRLTTTNHVRQNDRPKDQQTKSQVQLQPEPRESIKPESYQEPNKAKPDGAPKTDALLSEQTVSNKEQRKADWAIMKEMSRYLWPKVG